MLEHFGTEFDEVVVLVTGTEEKGGVDAEHEDEISMERWLAMKMGCWGVSIAMPSSE